MRIPALVCALTALLAAADPSFVLETRTVQPYTPAYLGNGVIGVSSTPLGTLPAEGIAAGVYDHAPDDVERIALVPAWNGVDVVSGGQSLNSASPNTLRSYHQTLDMYDGVLRTEYEWNGVGIRVEMFVSRADPELGAVKLVVAPRTAGLLKVLLTLRAWPQPKRYPLAKLEKLPAKIARNQQAIWYPGYLAPVHAHARMHGAGALLEMLTEAVGTRTTLTETAALSWPAGMAASARAGMDDAVVELTFHGRAGQEYTFYKVAELTRSFTGGRSVAASGEKAQRALARGYELLYREHAAAWHDLWRSDIVVDGDPALQTVLHSMQFYLLGSAGRDGQFSIPPMGLSTAGYYGHYFWDADTFLFPPLLLLHPELAKPVVDFRQRTLDAARANAVRNHRRGAMYPWEAAPDGSESTPRFAYQNALYENHVNGDVALAQWNYYLATGDRNWLANYGYPVIRDTAEFWTTRVSYNRRRDRYEIGKVVSVIESRIGVDNDPCTNATAKKNLELAIAAAKVLGQTPDPKWAEISRKMYLPRTSLMLMDYPLELPLTAADRRAILQEGLRRPAEGAMMGSEFYPMVSAELGDRGAMDRLFPKTFLPYLRPPFQVIPETPTNNNVNFITGAGAFLQQFLYGFSGLRLTEGGLTKQYSPMLPSRVRRMVLRGVAVRGERRDIIVENNQLR